MRRRTVPAIRAGLLAALLASLAATGALAQEAAPAPAEPSYAAPRPAPLQVEQLAPPDPDGAGLLETGQGGLDAAAWSGLHRAAAERLVGALPAAITSPAVRALARRALLTTAPSPQGKAARSWAGVRLERVAALGDARAAAELAAVVPAALEDEGAAREWAATLLLSGEADAACAKVAELTGRFQSAGWQELVIACHLKAGDQAPASLAMDLLREQGGKEDSFLRLADFATLGGKPAALKSLPGLSPAGLFLLRQGKRAVPADALHGASPAMLAAIAGSEETALAVRVQAAERAGVLGLFGARDLAQLYKRAGAGDRAALYQLLVKEQDPAGKANLLQRAVALGSPAELAGPYGELLAAELGIVAPTVQNQAVAPAAVRLLMLQGRGDLARPWIDLARAGGETGAVWPLLVAAGLEPAATGAAGWVGAMAGPGADGEPARRVAAGNVLALLGALGEIIDPALRADTLDAVPAEGAVAPAPALWFRADEAAQARRAGEVAILAALMLGDREPGSAVLVATHCVRQLVRAGLLMEARRLALETIAGLLPA